MRCGRSELRCAVGATPWFGWPWNVANNDCARLPNPHNTPCRTRGKHGHDGKPLCSGGRFFAGNGRRVGA